jgi:hypothetical protein
LSIDLEKYFSESITGKKGMTKKPPVEVDIK